MSEAKDREPGFRRPSPEWCTDVAIRVLRIGTREPGFLLEDGSRLLSHEEGELLVRAAAVLDGYGQRLAAAKGLDGG